MANIPISQVVQVNPRVVGAGGAQSSFGGLILTQNTASAPSSPLDFFTAADVADFFGPASDEAIAANAYFPGILGGGQLPASLKFARFAASATPAEVFGAPTGLTLAQLQALTGTLILSTSQQYTSSTINLAAATSFANAAALMTAGFTTPDFVIGYDGARDRFVVATTATGDDAEISAVTGTLATAVGLSEAAGAYAQTNGVDADTAAAALTRVTSTSTNWFAFTTAWAADIDERLDFAAWVSGAGAFEYQYAAWDTDAASTQVNNANSFGAQVFAVPYQGTVPVYGDLRHAAAELAWAASTNFEMVDGRNALAFRTPAAGIPASISSLAAANGALSNGYTYLGQYASNANDYVVFYNGALSGQFNWADTYIGQAWIRRNLQQALFEVLLAYNTLPYNQDGYNAIYQGAQGVISQAVQNGVIREGVTLSASQAAQVNQQAGTTISDELSTLGWHLQVRDPLTTAVRTVRGSPTVNFWYCDGGSIQRIVVSSTTVL